VNPGKAQVTRHTVASNVVKDQAEAFVASDYQGETIQVFVFLRGKFLGYQCFGQDRLTIGGGPRMDLPLPDCGEEEGYWDVYISRGGLYAWFRSPAGGNGKEGHEDPRKVQPLDSFSLGEYRLQAKLLIGQGFELPATETEEDLAEEEAAPSPEEEGVGQGPLSAEEEHTEEVHGAISPVELDPEEEHAVESVPEPMDEVEGISLDYARSIWWEETEEARTEAAGEPTCEVEKAIPSTDPEEDLAPAETVVAAAVEEEPVPEPALEGAEPLTEEKGREPIHESGGAADEADLSLDEKVLEAPEQDRPEEPGEENPLEADERVESESPVWIDPDYAKGFMGLSETTDTIQQADEEDEAEADRPDPSNDEAQTVTDIEEWIGFGLEEESPAEQSASVEEGEEEEGPVCLARQEPPQATVAVTDAEEPSEEEAGLAVQEASSTYEGMGETEEAQEEAPPEPEAADKPSALSTPEAGSGGLVEGMSQEERTSFWDHMAREAFANEKEEKQEPDEPPLQEPSTGVIEDQIPAELIGGEPSSDVIEDERPVEMIGNEPLEEVEFAQESKPAEEPEPLDEPKSEDEPAAATECGDREQETFAIDEPEAGKAEGEAAKAAEGEAEETKAEETTAEEEEDKEAGAQAAEAEEADAWEDDDEDEAEQDVTYFSLLKEVFPSRTEPSKAPRGDHRALEVVRFRGSDLQDIGYLEGGDDYTIRKGWSRSLWKRQGGVPPNFKLVRLKNGGMAELQIRDSVKGRLYSDQGSEDIWDLCGGKRGRFSLKGKASWLPLPADTWAVLRVNSGRYLVRYVSPRPKPMVQPLRPRVSKGQFKLVSLSMISHLLLILVVGLAVPDSTLEGYNRTDQFARIDPDALKALKPPPPPEKLKKPKPVAKKKVSKPKPKPKVASKHRIPKSAKKSPVPTRGKASGGGGKKQVDVAQTGLLAALGSPDAGVLDAKGNSEVLLAAVTNLDAVAVPSDTTTFNLAGVAGKLATSEIQVPTSDVIETVGAAQLIKNGDGTLGAMASKGSGEVRAVVHEPPKAKISIRGGMSREAVLKVVNAHLDEVRDCYERELLHNPGISGKILMEWLIQLDGTVRYAKVKFTNIGHSSDLHGCLQAQVVTWNFPRPKGGEEVLVTFPFLFESMGF
jgi:hypothetical protein